MLPWHVDSSSLKEEHARCCYVIGQALLMTASIVHRFSSIPSLLLWWFRWNHHRTCGISTLHHGAPLFQNKKCEASKKTKYRLRQIASFSLLVDRQGHVSQKLNHAFLFFDSFKSNFVC